MQDKSHDESIESKDPYTLKSRSLKIEAYAKAKQDLLSKSQLRGLKTTVFNTMTQRHTELGFLQDLKIKLPDDKEIDDAEKKRLEEILDRQIEVLISKGQDEKKNSIPIELQQFERDATFLLEQDFEEYAEILENDLYSSKDETPALQQFYNSTGLVNLKNGGKKDYLQAVVQSLLRIRPFADFMMNQKFKQVASDEDQPICKVLSQIFMDVNGEQSQLLKDIKPSYDLRDLERSIKQELGNVDCNAVLTIAQMIEKIFEEANYSDLEVKPASQTVQWFLKHSIVYKITSKTACENKHVLERSAYHSNIFKVEEHKSVK